MELTVRYLGFIACYVALSTWNDNNKFYVILTINDEKRLPPDLTDLQTLRWCGCWHEKDKKNKIFSVQN